VEKEHSSLSMRAISKNIVMESLLVGCSFNSRYEVKTEYTYKSEC